MKPFLVFIGFACGWSLLGSVALGLQINPGAVGIVWLIGFVWGVGYIAAGPRDADLLLKRWLQMMAGIIVVGGALALIVG